MGAHRLRQESTMVFQSRTKIENHHAPREYLFKIVFRHKRKPLQIGVLYKVIGNHLTRYNKSLTCGWFCTAINPYVRLYAMLLHNISLTRDGQMRYFKFKRAHRAQLSDEKVIAAYDFTFLHFLLNLKVKNVQLWQADEKKGILAQLWLKWNKRTTTRSFVRNSLLEYHHCVRWNCHQSPLNFQWRVPFQSWVPSMCFYGIHSMSFLHLHVKHFFCSMHARELRRHL